MERNIMNCLAFLESSTEVCISLKDKQDFIKVKVITDLLKEGAEVVSLIIEGKKLEPYYSLEESSTLQKVCIAVSSCSTLRSFTFSINLQ